MHASLFYCLSKIVIFNDLRHHSKQNKCNFFFFSPNEMFGIKAARMQCSREPMYPLRCG